MDSLQNKQKQIVALIKEWKHLLHLTEFNHKTIFYDSSNPPAEDDAFDIANNSIDPQKGTMYLKFNNTALRKMTPRAMRFNVIHELSHGLFVGVYHLFKNTVQMFNEKANLTLDKSFNDLEHKSISKLCAIFESFYCANKRLKEKYALHQKVR
jgi:flagellin-like hook-associated protein FlgL